MATTYSDLAFNSIPFLISFALIVLLFGGLLYFACLIWNVIDRSEDFEKNFLVRSFIVALLAAVFVVFIQFIFVLIFTFSPVFKETFNVNLMLSVLNTNILDMVLEVFQSPPGVLLMAIVMIALIVLFVSLVMLEAYKVSFLWTTIVTWTAIGIFLGLDMMLSVTGMPDGMSGIFRLIGSSFS